MISAIILTKNEEKNIEKCLMSLNWCDELIVIDDNSEDKTREIAKKNGARVVLKKLTSFSSQRNYGESITKNEWIFHIDADEVVPESLKLEILNAISSSLSMSGYSLRREDFLWGKKIRYGDGMNLKFVRLGRRGTGEWVGEVHEKWKIPGPIGELRTPLIHYPHQNVAEFLSEINKYSTLRSGELAREGKKSSALSILFYTKGKFLDNYLIKLGLLDGVPGLIRALMMSYYTFLVRSKLWTLRQKKR